MKRRNSWGKRVLVLGLLLVIVLVQFGWNSIFAEEEKPFIQSGNVRWMDGKYQKQNEELQWEDMQGKPVNWEYEEGILRINMFKGSFATSKNLPVTLFVTGVNQLQGETSYIQEIKGIGSVTFEQDFHTDRDTFELTTGIVITGNIVSTGTVILNKGVVVNGSVTADTVTLNGARVTGTVTETKKEPSSESQTESSTESESQTELPTESESQTETTGESESQTESESSTMRPEEKEEEPSSEGQKLPETITDDRKEETTKEVLYYALVDAEGKENTVVAKEVWSRYIGKDSLLVLKAEKYRWKVECSQLKETNIRNLDMGVTFGSTRIPEEVLETLIDDKSSYSTLSLSHEGSFGFTANLEYSVDSVLIGRTAKLYYYDGKNLQYQKQCSIGDDGVITLPFDHASEYVVVYETERQSKKDDSDATKEGTKGSGMKNATKIRVMFFAFLAAFLMALGGGIFCLTKYFKEKKRLEENEGTDSETDEA